LVAVVGIHRVDKVAAPAAVVAAGDIRPALVDRAVDPAVVVGDSHRGAGADLGYMTSLTPSG